MRVSLRVSDLEASTRFYDTVLGREWGSDLQLVQGEPTRNLHVGFAAPDDTAVDAFHAAGVEAGYRSDGTPGPREHHYGAFLLDPDGNSIEAVHYDGVRERGIDHVWLRADDIAGVRSHVPAGEKVTVVGGEPTANVEIAFANGTRLAL